MIKKELGKITKAEFGIGGYQDAMIGLHFAFDGDGWGTSTSEYSTWDLFIEPTENAKWTEKDRSEIFDKAVRKLSQLLSDSKKRHIGQLVGVPIEATFEDNMLKEWRILKEVL